ncbi:alpha/beta hydrolase [Gryllotalpicola daejeonensis]|uniref:Alpha/beta hydrolase n=1 Tax=Gryllotalpicola daejeonensis TaxID=993087 RepID=A0ABP7ZDL1_9MICO
MSEVDLEPGALAWVARINETSARLPGLFSSDLTAMRAASTQLANALAREFTAPAPEDVVIDEVEIDAGGRMLRLRRYAPEGISSPRPTQVFLHGGGFIKGSPRELQNDRILAARARGAGIQVLSLQYALAPEHPYPVARDQLIDLLAALTATPELADVDAARLGVGGNSAGAGVVATAVLKWCADDGAPLAHQLLEVPPATVRDFGESFELYGRGFGLDDIDQLTALILPEGAADEYASALDYARRREAPISGYPRTLVMTAEYDPLRDTAEEFARELQRLGAPVELIRGARQLHGGSALTAATDGARLWQRRAIDELSAAYATAATAAQPTSAGSA